MRVVPSSIVPPKEGTLRKGVSMKGPIITTVVALDAGAFAISVRLPSGMCLGLLGSRRVWSAASRCLPGGACGAAEGAPAALQAWAEEA